MDPDAGDVPGVVQSQVLPGISRVGGAVDTVAVGDVDANAGLAGPRVDHVGVGIGDGNGSHGGGIEEAVGDVLPVGAAVGGLPYPTGTGTEVKNVGVHGITGDGDYAPAPVRAYATPSEDVVDQAVECIGLSGGFGLYRFCHSGTSFISVSSEDINRVATALLAMPCPRGSLPK